MGTTADKLNFTRDSLNELGAEMESKNPAFSKDMPLNEWKNYLPTSGGGWQRPSSRPAVPIIAEGEQVMYWLFGVSEHSPNDFAIILGTSTGQYRMEWGDGTSNDYNSNAKSEHMFDYASVSGNPTEEGYKWVWIKATPLTGNFTYIGINVRHSLRPSMSGANIVIPQVFEWYLQAPYVTTFPFSSTTYTRYTMLDIFDYRGENQITSFTYFASNWKGLKRLNIDTSNGTDFSYCLYSCSALNWLSNPNTSNGKNFINYLRDCSSLNHPIVVDLASATTAIGVSFIGDTCFALKSLRLLNMGSIHTALTISNSSLDVDALVALFGDLYDRTGIAAGTLTITGVFGAARLTAEQKAIATSKNWSLVGA